ncbi:MAG: hypothetical protein LBQ36_03025, partial [Synergistaceae bacterium]|nr:hypothetical protein [Synergistaceae bacterium]
MKKTVAMLAVSLIILTLSSVAVHAASDKVGFIDARSILPAHPKYESSQKYVDEFITKKSEDARAAAEKEPDAAKRMEIIDTARRECGQ